MGLQASLSIIFSCICGAYDPSTGRTERGRVPKAQRSLGYTVKSRSVWVIVCDPASTKLPPPPVTITLYRKLKTKQ